MSSHPNMWLRGLQIQINHDAPIETTDPESLNPGYVQECEI